MTVQEQQTYTVQVPDAARRVNLPLNKIRVWKIDGTQLSEDQYKSSFANPRHVFLLNTDASEYRADPFYQSLLSPTALVISVPSEAPAAELAPVAPIVVPKPSSK